MSEENSPLRKEGVFGAARRPGALELDLTSFPSTKEWRTEYPSKLSGYFTIERHITGANLEDLEATIGYKNLLLRSGARIYAFTERPQVGQFVYAGSSRTPNAKGLVSVGERMKAASKVIPGAWLNERLVKVVPVQRPSDDPSNYPKAKLPVEQWRLLVELPVKLVGEVHGIIQRYYPR